MSQGENRTRGSSIIGSNTDKMILNFALVIIKISKVSGQREGEEKRQTSARQLGRHKAEESGKIKI